jgi:ribose-phosphate pyrophosphokinase
VTPELVLCVGTGAEHLRGALERELGVGAAEVECRRFPDGETLVRVHAALEGAAVAIVQGTHPPQDTRLQELYQLVDVAAAGGAARVVCVVPYLAYARQDRRSAPGEAASGAIVLRTLAMLGASELVAVDAHSARLLDEAPLPARSLSAADGIADWIRSLELEQPLVVSPDAGGVERAERVAAALACEPLALAKSKDSSRGTWYDGGVAEVEGRDVVIVDDLCSSGSTFVPLARHLRACGARRLAYCVTHFFADADALREKVGFPVEIAGTDTIPTRWSRISVAPLVGRWLRERSLAPALVP